MDKLNFVRDGESKLPPGFRFQPTDEEIVFQYLSRKIFSHPLPAQIIPEIDVFSFDPWELPGDWDQDKYFFSNKGWKSRYNNGCGFWKASGSLKRIICSERMPIVGIRKTFVFYKLGSVATDCIMHQYCIAFSGNPDNNNNVHQLTNNSKGSLIRIGDWSLCHIYFKKRCRNAHDDDNDDDIIDMHSSRDFLTEDISDTYSSSGSSSSPHSNSSIFNEVSSTYNI